MYNFPNIRSFIIIVGSCQLLDFLLGKGRAALFRRAELKTLVALHANEVRIFFSVIIKESYQRGHLFISVL